MSSRNLNNAHSGATSAVDLLSNNLQYINDVCTSHAVGEAVIVFSGVRVCLRKTDRKFT